MRKDLEVCVVFFVFFCFYGCSAGTGQMAGIELESVSGGLSQSEIGEMRDLSAQHLIRFHDQNPGTAASKALVITNTTCVYLLISLMCFSTSSWTKKAAVRNVFLTVLLCDPPPILFITNAPYR